MSHMTTVTLQFKDPIALEQACHDVGATLTRHSSAIIYHTHVTGDIIHLPGWVYPVAVKDRELLYDNYNGEWGAITILNHLRQRYTLHAARRQVAAMGRRIAQHQQVGNKIRLVIPV